MWQLQKDAEWCRQLLKEIGLNPTITIYTDNEAALKLTKTQTFHRRTRHRTQISLYPGSSQEGETENIGDKRQGKSSRHIDDTGPDELYTPMEEPAFNSLMDWLQWEDLGAREGINFGAGESVS